MKSAILYFLLATVAQLSYAQKEYPNCEKTLFKTGGISTKKCYDADKRFGKAFAFNKKNEIIYEKELRNIGGHASVYFTFYPSGAIQKAEWSSAPDAGIQWYNSTDVFDEDGKLISHTENNYDDYIQLRTPLPVKKDTVIIIKPEKNDTIISEKKKVETWFVNHTYYPIYIITTDKKTNQILSEKKIFPGDSSKIIVYDFTIKNFEPNRKYSFMINSVNNNKEQIPYVKKITSKTLQTKNKAFYYIIENK